MQVTPDSLKQAYRLMLRARLLDEKSITLFKQNKSHFQISSAGHEGVQVAAAQVFQPGHDWFFPYYRDLAFCAALGLTDREFFLAVLNKAADPSSHGREMPMHYGHKGLRIVNQSSPTGSQYLQAVGCAQAIKTKGRGEVVYVSSGESACAQGDFHEALNWAAREKLPLIFLIENNGYGISVPVSQQIAGSSIVRISQGYLGLEAREIDGTNYLSSLEVFSAAYDRAVSGKGPSLIEAHVVRLQSHSISDNQKKYRQQEELLQLEAHCPVLVLKKLLQERGIMAERELMEIERNLQAEINAAAEWAEGQADCSPEEICRHNIDEADESLFVAETTPQGAELYMFDALNHALREELERDPRTYVFGQDVAGNKGGVFSVTAGLTAAFGETRVFNAPLAESSIIGVALGMAVAGLKPIPEIQFADYIWTGMNQLRNEVAMLRHRSGGEFSCPMVVRVPVGGYISGGPYHSQNIEATFAHFPGLFVVYPSNAADAKGLLKASIRSTNPILFLEHKGLYRQPYAKGPAGDPDHIIPLGKARIVRRGEDATLVCWGALVHKALVAAAELAKEGYSVEVLDLRTLIPLDTQAVFESARRTGRVLIAHEDVLFMGFGAEIAAQISAECFTSLDAPVRRLGMRYAACVPHSPVLESAALPQNDDVRDALRELLAF